MSNEPASVRAVVALRHRDIDALGHVNQAVYHEFLEELRSAFFSQALPELPFTGYVLAHVELDYRHEVRIEDRQLTGECHAGRLGRSSIELVHRLLLDDGTVAVEVAPCSSRGISSRAARARSRRPSARRCNRQATAGTAPVRRARRARDPRRRTARRPQPVQRACA